MLTLDFRVIFCFVGLYGNKCHTCTGHEGGPSVIVRTGAECQWFLLMGEGNGIQSAVIIITVDKFADGRMHASLAMKHFHDVFRALQAAQPVQAFKQGVTAVGQPDGLQAILGHP